MFQKEYMNHGTKLGDIVAASMKEIIQSDEHKKTFFNKKASDKCCSCNSCGKDCACKECDKECKGCVEDKNHVHDSNCAHDKTSVGNVVDEMVTLLSKISTVQDELGLVKSSVVTMQALATLVAELRKNAQEDTNDIRWGELISGIDKDVRRDFRATQFDDPEIIDLLRRRVEESHLPNIAEEGVSADGASDFPLEPDAVIIPPDIGDEDLSTWAPNSSRMPTEHQELSLGRIEKIPDIDQSFGDRDLSIENRGLPTVPVAKDAFTRLNDLLKKQAQDDLDFEDEPDVELEELMRDIPDVSGGEMDSDPKLFGLDDSFSDDSMWAEDDQSGSDLDGEIEFGDFLEPLDDDGPGFNYRGPSELYDNTKTKKVHGPLPKPYDHIVGDHLVEYDDQEKHRDPSDLVRVGPDKWIKFDELTPEERLEQEMGAGLHEQLDIDPDSLTNEEVYPDDWEEPHEDDDLKQYWND